MSIDRVAEAGLHSAGDIRCRDGRMPLCGECAAPFVPGDRYVLVDLDTGRPAADPLWGAVVCVGCAASAEVAP